MTSNTINIEDAEETYLKGVDDVLKGIITQSKVLVERYSSNDAMH